MTSTEKTQLLLRISNLENNLKRAYGASYSKIIQLQGVRKAIENSEDDFLLANHPDIEKQIDKILRNLNSQTTRMISLSSKNELEAGVANSWKAITKAVQGANKDDAALKSLRSVTEQVHRRNVLVTYKKRELDIAKSVWSYSEQSKREMEIVVQNAILQGRSAAQTATDLKKYLNKPYTLFRRVKVKGSDALELSKAARDYHPGAGVYRSAYRNALRLARTETNNAYREGECQSYQDNPLVKGFEIRLSNNHTTKMPDGTVAALVDICDELAGIYPPWFKFRGWHPQCRCSMIPITLTSQEFSEYSKAKREGKLDEWKAKQGQIKLPKQFVNWFKDHRSEIDKAAKAGKLPYFIVDNIEGVISELEANLQDVEVVGQVESIDQVPESDPRIAQNTKEIALALGIKVEDIVPMSVEEADKQNANPNYQPRYIEDPHGHFIDIRTGVKYSPNTKWREKYTINCQTCVQAFILRLRGLPVYAKGRGGAEGVAWQNILAVPGQISKCWRNKDGSEVIQTRMDVWFAQKGVKDIKIKDFMDFYNEACKEEGFYLSTFTWKENRGGHAVVFWRKPNGELVGIDPQVYNKEKGMEINIEELCEKMHKSPLRQRGQGVVRVDDKIFYLDALDIFKH